MTRYLASFLFRGSGGSWLSDADSFSGVLQSLRQHWVGSNHEIRQYSEDQKGLKETSGVKHPASILIQTSSVAVTLHTSEEKGQLEFSKKNLRFIVKRMLCFGPALQCSVWL